MDHARAIDALANCGAAVAALETEHDAIDDILYTLNKAMQAGADGPAVVRILDIVIDYCASHFLREERFLRAHGDTGIDAHAAAHTRFAADLAAIRSRLSGGCSDALLDLVDLLDLLRTHIVNGDHPAYERVLVTEGVENNEIHRATELARLKRMGR